MKSTNVLYLDKNRFDLYNEEQNKIFNFDLSNFTQNLEIINKQDLETQIKAFITNFKLSPGGIIIILSENILFVKGLPPDTEINQDDGQDQKFINSVPFEHVAVKTYPIEGGQLLVAANRDFYSSIKLCFDNNGFKTNIVTPIYSTGATINPDTGLDENTGKTLLKNEAQLKLNGIEVLVEKEAVNTPIITTGKPEKKRLIRLLSVFGILIVVFLGVLINSFRNQNTPSGQSAILPSVTPLPQNTIVQIASSSSVLTTETVRVKILHPSSATTSGNLVKAKLNEVGFRNILQESTTSISNSPIVIFTNTVPADIRTHIINNLSQITTNLVIQETQISEADVTIFLIK